MRFVMLLLVLALAGCQSPTPFPQPTAAWKTQTGQMQYVGPDGKSVIGDVVVRRSPAGDFQLAFSSGPGFPLMRLSVSGVRARAEGVLARGSWEGAPGKAPARLQGWMRLPAALAGGAKTVNGSAGEERFVLRVGGGS